MSIFIILDVLFNRSFFLFYFTLTRFYLRNILHFSVFVYCNRSQLTSQRVENKKVQHATVVA